MKTKREQLEEAVKEELSKRPNLKPLHEGLDEDISIGLEILGLEKSDSESRGAVLAWTFDDRYSVDENIQEFVDFLNEDHDRIPVA